jgi:hypothetical protein
MRGRFDLVFKRTGEWGRERRAGTYHCGVVAAGVYFAVD